jgi:glycosyltransferase involved in cell wall biosynthesis
MVGTAPVGHHGPVGASAAGHGVSYCGSKLIERLSSPELTAAKQKSLRTVSLRTSPMHLLFAPNVRGGGGVVLLQALLCSWPGTPKLSAVLDERARSTLHIPEGIEVRWTRPTLVSRLVEEWRLKRAVQNNIDVLCFHGMPPLFLSTCSRSNVRVFLQNRLLVENGSFGSFAIKERVRLQVERCLLRWKIGAVSEIIVQTPSMKKLVAEFYKGLLDVSAIHVRLFEPNLAKRSLVGGCRFDFVYPASGEPHKNHFALIEAWTYLKQKGLCPSLALTLSERDATLWKKLKVKADEAGLAVTNLGSVPHDRINEVYESARAVIFPSVSESLGLPLLEAAQFDLPILAGELDFVRDICSPAQTFDPSSAISIARAVMRFLNVETHLAPPSSPEVFWSALSVDAR